MQQLVAQVQLLTKEAERAQAATALLENARFTDMQRTMDLQAQVITMAAAAAAASSKPQLARVTFVDTKASASRRRLAASSSSSRRGASSWATSSRGF